MIHWIDLLSINSQYFSWFFFPGGKKSIDGSISPFLPPSYKPSKHKFLKKVLLKFTLLWVLFFYHFINRNDKSNYCFFRFKLVKIFYCLYLSVLFYFYSLLIYCMQKASLSLSFPQLLKTTPLSLQKQHYSLSTILILLILLFWSISLTEKLNYFCMHVNLRFHNIFVVMAKCFLE